jgi:putative transposase
MARLTRLALAGRLHHLALRGHSGAAVFADDADRERFVECLRLAAAEQGVAVHAYVLLDAEVQCLATPVQADALGRAMQSLGRRYVSVHNRRHGRSGTLWEGRFRSSVLEPATWLLSAMVYIETLALRRGAATEVREWPWSSAPAHLGLRRDAVLTEHALRWSLGNTPFDRERAHADLLGRGISEMEAEALERALHSGLALGSSAFLSELRADSSRPLTPRRRGRPKGVVLSP